MSKALIVGISGQDGAYLSRHLLAQGDIVVGTARQACAGSFAKLALLGLADRVHILSLDPTDLDAIGRVLAEVEPDEIYLLSGQSSVGQSFAQPQQTFDSIAVATQALLEAARLHRPHARLFFAGSAECFDDQGELPLEINTPFAPRNPYGAAKCAAFWSVATYRRIYGIFAVTGILFPHESPLRDQRFVSQKIVQAAKRIAAGSNERLTLGKLSLRRDWGWAQDTVAAMAAMLSADSPLDFVIGTGEASPLSAFVDELFTGFGLDWRNHVDESPGLERPSDPNCVVAATDRTTRLLHWTARNKMQDVARKLVQCALHGEYE